MFVSRTPMQRRLARVPGRLVKEDKGAVLVEAAIVIPILLMIFLALVEFTEAFTAKRRAAAVAATAADLTAQALKVSTSDLNDIVYAANSIMAPFSASPLSVTISSVGYDSHNNLVDMWSCSWSSPTAGGSCTGQSATPVTLPSGLITQGSGQCLIVAQTSYTFTPAIGQFLLSGVNFSQSAYYVPRLTECIQKTA